MARRPIRMFGAFGALALVAVAVPAGVAAAGTERVPVAAGPVTTQADTVHRGKLSVPRELEPPAGHVVHSVLKARGVQLYRCASGSWTLVEPAASLTGVVLRPAKKVTALHYRGPSWQSDQDGSLVEADAASAVRAPSRHPDSIPQLRLTARESRGGGLFGAVTYIQRLDTVGGVAPAGPCTGSATDAVAYRAVYRFFVKKA